VRTPAESVAVGGALAIVLATASVILVAMAYHNLECGPCGILGR